MKKKKKRGEVGGTESQSENPFILQDFDTLSLHWKSKKEKERKESEKKTNILIQNKTRNNKIKRIITTQRIENKK